MVSIKLQNINFEDSNIFLSDVDFSENLLNCVLSQDKGILEVFFKTLLLLDSSNVESYTINNLDSSLFSYQNIRKELITVLYGDSFKFSQTMVDDYFSKICKDSNRELSWNTREFLEEISYLDIMAAPLLDSTLFTKKCSELSFFDKIFIKVFESTIKQSKLFIVFIDDIELNEIQINQCGNILEEYLLPDCCIVILSRNTFWANRADNTIKI
ncbi:hypothetical protein ACTGWG_11095 [Streptococcus suis]